jgi:limonene 1,2-monooxygenase
MVAAGKHGIGVLSVASYMEAGIAAAKTQWRFCEQAASDAGRTPPDRATWRLVVPFHLAATREQAIEDIEVGVQRWYNEYLINTLGAPNLVPVESGRQLAEGMNAFGGAIVGTPDDAIQTITRLQEITGGFGCLLGLAHEWTTREKIYQSYELMARYVVPEFQDTTSGTKRSLGWTLENKESLMAGRQAALDKAIQKHTAPQPSDGAGS